MRDFVLLPPAVSVKKRVERVIIYRRYFLTSRHKQGDNIIAAILAINAKKRPAVRQGACNYNILLNDLVVDNL